MSDKRYEVRIGDLVTGERREYKTLPGARRGAKRLQDEGKRVTLWEGTLRGWGGWSWSSLPIDEGEDKR
jgi:hypothetical protein